jgi:hypothetical protein
MDMNFFDKKVQQAQDESEKLLAEYARLLSTSPEAASIKTMTTAGAPPTSIADRAANTHRTVFAQVMSAAPPKLLKEARRVQIIEQFCLSMWGKYLNQGAYSQLLKKLGKPVPRT